MVYALIPLHSLGIFYSIRLLRSVQLFAYPDQVSSIYIRRRNFVTVEGGGNWRAMARQFQSPSSRGQIFFIPHLFFWSHRSFKVFLQIYVGSLSWSCCIYSAIAWVYRKFHCDILLLPPQSTIVSQVVFGIWKAPFDLTWQKFLGLGFFSFFRQSIGCLNF